LDDAPEYYGLMAEHEDEFVKSFMRPVGVTRGELTRREEMAAGRR
jgi:hypothetical protein